MVPHLFTHTSFGDWFVLRNAGNLVPPYGAVRGGEASTIEYAMQVLQIPHIIVCGHTDCGAMKGLLHPEGLTDMPAMRNWLEQAETTRRRIHARVARTASEDPVETAACENVLVQLDNLRTHPTVAVRLMTGEVHVHGWIYDIEYARVLAYDERAQTFVPLENLAVTEPPAELAAS